MFDVAVKGNNFNWTIQLKLSNLLLCCDKQPSITEHRFSIFGKALLTNWPLSLRL